MFEREGRPAALVVLDTFASLATTKAHQMGMPAMRVLTVPGPIGTPDQARAKGDDVLDDVVQWLSGEEAR